MDRQQREVELRTILATPGGEEELLAIFRRHAGQEEGTSPPSGPQLVESILNFEYQSEGVPQQGRAAGTAADPSQPVPKKGEPGDVKFADPPAAEAPGG